MDERTDELTLGHSFIHWINNEQTLLPSDYHDALRYIQSIKSQHQQNTALFSSPFDGPSLQYTGGSDPNNANYVKLTDALQEADTERRKDREAADQRERAAEIRREERQAKIDYMNAMPDEQPAGTVDEFMFKEGVQDQLDKLDHDLVGLVPVKQRVKEIAALLVLDKMRRKVSASLLEWERSVSDERATIPTDWVSLRMKEGAVS